MPGDIFINKSGLFKEDDFKQDLDNLRTYYNWKGYIDMEVKDVKFEYPAAGLMKVTITVFEGIQYTVGKIDFDGNTIFTKQELRNYHGIQNIRMDEGKVYSPRAYTLQEVVRRGRMTWPELIAEIVPDITYRSAILSSLGIRPPPAE